MNGLTFYSMGNAHSKHVEEIWETDLFWILFSAAVQWEIKFGILYKQSISPKALPSSLRTFSFVISKRVLSFFLHVPSDLFLVTVVYCPNSQLPYWKEVVYTYLFWLLSFLMEEVIPWLRKLICHGPGSAESNENQKFYADAAVPGATDSQEDYSGFSFSSHVE